MMDRLTDPVECSLQRELDKGIEAQQKGDPDTAIDHYTTVIFSELVSPSKLTDAYERRAGCYHTKGCFGLAIEDYSQTIERMPDHRDYANVYVNRGLAYFKKGNFNFAIVDLTKAVQLRPDYTQAYSLRGRIYYKKGEIVSSIEDFTSIIQLPLAGSTTYSDAYYRRGIAWLHLREWEKAKSDLTAARNRGKDIVSVFRRHYGSVEDFQRKIGINLPKDIISILTHSES